MIRAVRREVRSLLGYVSPDQADKHFLEFFFENFFWGGRSFWVEIYFLEMFLGEFFFESFFLVGIIVLESRESSIAHKFNL